MLREACGRDHAQVCTRWWQQGQENDQSQTRDLQTAFLRAKGEGLPLHPTIPWATVIS
jgi:hypothetical protein